LLDKRTMSGAQKFQVTLSGEWKDYSATEDKILKRAYLAGFPNAKYTLRNQDYEVDFKGMKQTNKRTGKERKIRAPHKWKPPDAPITAPGPNMCVKVPPGSPGTTIHVPHPKDATKMIAVNVPKTAKVGQAMLVPVPALDDVIAPSAPSAPPPVGDTSSSTTASTAAPAQKAGWSTGAKVAAGTAAVVGVGGLAVGGAILGEHIAEEGWDATMAELGDAAEGAGEAIVDAAEDAGEWIEGAADTAGDFIMDLF